MISPLAYIHSKTNIGSNVTIDPFAVIHEDVTVGDGTHVMSHAVIFNNTIIGKNCRIFPGAVVGAIPQDLKFAGEITSVEVGDNTTIREGVTIHRGTKQKWKTVVGSHCLLMAYSHVAHDCIVGDNVILANAVQLAGHVEVGDYAILGGLTGVHQFTRIGAHAYVAGNSGVRKDVPPYVKAAREPMSFVGINVIGLQRSKFNKETIEEISAIYHTLFIEKNTTSSALEKIEKNFADSSVKNIILQFIKNSTTGIIKRPSKSASDDDYAF